MNKLFLNTSRDCHGAEDCVNATMTVRDLIDLLQEYDEDMPIMFKNDGGYTYGFITSDSVEESED